MTAASVACGQDLGARADSVMRMAEKNGFSGVVRIEKEGVVLLEKGYGFANRAEKIPFAPSTVVQIGSNTKDFTAVSILQLQERGKLGIRDSLGKFFPSAPADKRDITLLQVMKHEAGFPLGLGGDFEAVTRDQFIANAMRFKLLFTPGARESYSNTGYALLAAIIETVSGKSYDEYVRDNILIPLGLTRTGFHLPNFDRRQLAHGYSTGGEDAGTMLSKAHAPDGPWWNLRGNGGMLSTVADMHAFYEALFETDKLLRPATRAIMFDPSEPIALAGSDLVNFFVYERDPATHMEMIIASTNAEQRAPAVRRDIARAIGGSEGGRIEKVTGAGAPLARRAGGRPPSAAVARVISDFVSTINKGDAASLRQFIVEHFAHGPGVPTADERLSRLTTLHRNLGTLKVVRMDALEDGRVDVVLDSEREGEALLIIDTDSATPPRIRRLGVQVGGSDG